SGTGKTALVRAFLEAQRADPDLVVLPSRCYVHESVPYKALDGVVDRLSRLLVSLPEEEARVLLPRDISSLARLFPVMSTVVEALLDRPPPTRQSFDRLDIRRRAFASLRDLLTRLADRRPVIIYIDDLQWADADSAILLEELLRPPEPPPLLLLATFRSEELDKKPFLRDLLAATGTPTRKAVAVTPLTERQIRDLVDRLLSAVPEARAFAPTIAREAAGSPFLAEQLATYVLQGDDVGATGVGLSEVLNARIAQQPDGARPLLRTLAVAAHPLPSNVAAAAAGLAGDERPLVKSLVNARLLRRSGADEHLETYHDRIRETLAASLELEAARRTHLKIAAAMERHGLDDPEALFGHYRGAGDKIKAALYADRAAAKASDALAFDQAAQFYQYALELTPSDGDLPEESATHSRLSKARLERGLGDALANAGRCKEAAAAYLRAAALVDAQRGLELRRAAAEQLLSSGHLDDGRRVLDDVLQQVGMRLPPTPKRALLSLLTRRVKLKIRGYGYNEQPEAKVAPDKLHMIDICWAVSTGLSMIDNIRGADFTARSLLLALDAGEPVRVANTLSMEAAFLASGGGANQEQAFKLAQQAIDIAKSTGNPAPLAQATMTAAAASYLCGQWKRAANYATEADVMLRERCPGAIWQTATAGRFRYGALMYLGEIRELTRSLPYTLRDAEDRGNLYSNADLKARLFLNWLAHGDPAGHRDVLADVFRRWTSEGYHIQHFNALRSLLHGDLYEGEIDRAEQRFAEQQASLEGSMLLRVQLVRGETHQLKAMIGLARFAAGKVPSSRKRAAHKAITKAIKALAGEGEPWCLALADLLRAGQAKQQGDDDGARNYLLQSIADLRAADMALHAACAERALGLLEGGDKGAARVAAADSWMRDQAIQDPARITQAMAPGLTEPV
ncbi:MAG: AAA family ATPase, partial [Myxococcales bacterium]|nr:AAA family ATPase [Myxococcales bacterium]